MFVLVLFSEYWRAKMRKFPNWNYYFFAFVSVIALSTLTHAQAPGSNADKAVSLSNRGLQLFKQGKLDEAIAQYREALVLRPDFPEALSNLGLALDAKGKDDEALADFDKALALKPGDAVTESNRGLALYHEKKIRGIGRGISARNFVSCQLSAGLQRNGSCAFRRRQIR
jgi:tetratricopeptide (TPR) repeat protein